ncbi:hypothetical protein TWF696_004695 [Orbilia brochopaga]|uniref:Uncharacterized protein n=1 Tax=Orbilia brochopaga TaxID=3140254 RepID=A0AAV9V705_9PEZI
MGLFSKLKDSSKKNRHSVSVQHQPHPPPEPSNSPGPSIAASKTAGSSKSPSLVGGGNGAPLNPPPPSGQPVGHSSPNLVTSQDPTSAVPIPLQPGASPQQPSWGFPSSPNAPAQGQFWPPQGQYGFPPQPPYGQPIYILQNGQLVPVFTGQQIPPPMAPPIGSPLPPGNIQFNPPSQSPAPAPYSSSPFQVPPLPVPPAAPPSGPTTYQYAAQPTATSDHAAVSPVSPVSESSTSLQSPPEPPPAVSNSMPSPAEVTQAAPAATKPMTRKPVPATAPSAIPSSVTPPPVPAASTTVAITQDLGAMSLSQLPANAPGPVGPGTQLSPQMEQKVEFLKNQGNSMVEAKNFDQAVMFYSMALDYNPESAVCLSNRSMAYTKMQPPKMQEAKADAEAATKADPTYWKGWSRLGDALLSMGEPSQAIDAYNKALEVGGTAVGQNTKQSLANAKRAISGKGKATSQTPSASPTSTRKASGSASSPVASKSPTASKSKPAANSTRPAPAPASTAASIPAAQSPPRRAQPPPLNTQTAPLTRGASASTSTAAASSTANANTPTSPTANAPTRTAQAATGLPAVLEEAVANVEEVVNSEAPPAYAPNPNSTDPTIRHMSQQAVYAQVIELRNTLLVRNKGSFVIKPYTAVGNIDAVRIEFVGMTTQELTPRELGVHPDQHPSFAGYFVNSLLYPGCTLIDLDMEVSKIGEGRFPGTYSVSGYSEVYRAQQLETAPILPITLSSAHPLPEITVDQIVSRMTLLKYNRLLPETNMQMYEHLRKFLGPDPYPNQTDADKASLRNQITDICYVLNRVDATRYADMSNCRHLTNNTLGTSTQGIGLKNFLFQILLGCELLVRLLKEPANASYSGLISHNISANLVISDLWMQNIDTRRETTAAGQPRHLLISLVHQRQCEGLIRFAETLKWPYMDEARNYIEGAYNDLITGKAIGFDMCDWLFGLVRPGKLFRHLIMNCLVYSSPSIRDFQGAPTFTCGLSLPNRSYWPRRSVLGGVLGGLRNLTSVCGWVGPAPKAEGVEPGWCQVDARKVTIPIPCTKSQRTAEELEEARIGPDGRVMNAEEQISDLADIAQWAVPTFPARPNPDNTTVTFKGIRLLLQQDQAAITTLAPLKIYRAAVDFDISGTQVSYTLYCNPTFVAAHPCVGSHLAHRTETKAIRKTIIPAVDLKETYLQYNSLLVIDATLKGEEVLARAWCSERGCNAVIWRGDETCFACAALMTMSTNGLGFNVLIRSV